MHTQTILSRQMDKADFFFFAPPIDFSLAPLITHVIADISVCHVHVKAMYLPVPACSYNLRKHYLGVETR